MLTIAHIIVIRKFRDFKPLLDVRPLISRELASQAGRGRLLLAAIQSEDQRIGCTVGSARYADNGLLRVELVV